MLRGKLKLIIASFLVFGIMASGGYLAARQFLAPPAPAGQGDLANGSAPEAPGTLNVLLLGTDARPGEKVGNTDTIIVAHFDQDRIALLSIPRDTRVNIPGHGPDKINAAFSIGGPEMTASIAGDLLGVPINKYALVRWDGFMKIVDLLGGVTVDIPRNMYYYDPVDGPQYKINLKKGLQHLDGRQALAFVRFREEALGDIDRTGQQQALLKALFEKVKQPATLLKLPRLLPEIHRNVETNMGLDEMLTLAKAGINLKNMNLVTQTLPGYFLTLKGISYWGVDPGQARQVAQALFDYGQTTKQVVLDTPSTQVSGSSKGTIPTNKSSLSKGTTTGTRVPSRPPVVKEMTVTTPTTGSGSNRPPANNIPPSKQPGSGTTNNSKEPPTSQPGGNSGANPSGIPDSTAGNTTGGAVKPGQVNNS